MPKLSVKEMLETAKGLTTEMCNLDTWSTEMQLDAESNFVMADSIFRFQNDINLLNRDLHSESNEEAMIRIKEQVSMSARLVKENIELKQCKEEYENVMEFIMKKYREYTASKAVDSNAEFKKQYKEMLLNIIRNQDEKIKEMIAVMQRAAYIDDNAISNEFHEISRLRSENKMLRELLQISDDKPMQPAEMTDKAVETTAGNPSDEPSLSGNDSIIDNGADSFADTSEIIVEQPRKLTLEDDADCAVGGAEAPSVN